MEASIPAEGFINGLEVTALVEKVKARAGGRLPSHQKEKTLKIT